MQPFHERRFPGESDEYRKVRDELLAREMELRERIAEVAALRGRLPPGGRLPQDYVFEEAAGQTRFSQLFAPDKSTLVVYSFMYAPGGKPCPMCTSILDALDGTAPHAGDRVNLVVIAKASAGELGRWARERGWNHLRLLSSKGNSYNRDYHAEDRDENQLPAINVFRRTDEGIFHFWNAELLYAPAPEGQHPRHADLIWPLWNLFDLTPEGRGADWYPRLAYD